MGFGFPAIDEFGLDDFEASLFDYFVRLDFLRENLRQQFDSAFEFWAELSEIESAVANEWEAMGREAMQVIPADPERGRSLPTIVANVIYTPGLYSGEMRQEATLLCAESSAGSFILMADDVLQRLRHEIAGSANDPPAAQFALCAIADGTAHATTLIYAAGNAYRHNKDWDGLIDSSGRVNTAHRQYRAAKTTLSILEATVGLEAAYGRNVCCAALAMLSSLAEPSFESAWKRFDEIGEDFADQYCERDDAFRRVQEALEYQSNYNSVEVSFSTDMRLFPDKGTV